MKTLTIPKQPKGKKISYAKWGYIFLIPFFVVYLIFTLYPQLKTVFYSFFEYYRTGRKWVGPSFIGVQNYISLFSPENGSIPMILRSCGNTLIMWVMGAVPQFAIALLLAVIFTSTRLKLKFSKFFQSVFYFPNLIMASAFALLFFQVFGDVGPANDILMKLGIISTNYKFLSHEWSTKILIAVMNYLMWFGNTTILLMAGIQSIDESLFESARLDGSNSWRVFKDITMPLLKPIFIYALITSMIGGLQMFDVPQILTNGFGSPNNTTKTMVMLLNDNISSTKNYGMAGAISVVLFVITGILSFAVYRGTNEEE